MGAVTITRVADPAGIASSGGVTGYGPLDTGSRGEPGRCIVVCIGKEVATVAPTAVSLISNDWPAFDMVQAVASTFGNQGAWIYWAFLPPDSSQFLSVTITWSGAVTAAQNHITVYTVYNGRFPPRVQAGATSTDMDATAPLTTGSQTINANGGALACASCGTDTVAKTWANITEDLDADAGDFRWTTATRVTALAATAMTCTGATNNEDGAMAYIIVDEALAPPDLVTQLFRSPGF